MVSSPVTLSDEITQSTPATQEDAQSGSPGIEPGSSMQEFYQLYQELLIITFVLTVIIFVSVWIFYSLNIAANYLLGAFAGLIYLRMLAKDVEGLGNGKQQLSKTRLGLLVILILLASQWDKLQILPIFLGFLTYKAALMLYVVRMAFNSDE